MDAGGCMRHVFARRILQDIALAEVEDIHERILLRLHLRLAPFIGRSYIRGTNMSLGTASTRTAYRSRFRCSTYCFCGRWSKIIYIMHYIFLHLTNV